MSSSSIRIQRKANIFLSFSTISMVAYYILIMLTNDNSHSYLFQFLCVFAWVAFSLIADTRAFSRTIINRKALVIILFSFFSSIQGLLSHSISTALGGSMGIFTLFVPVLMFDFCLYTMSLRKMKKLCVFFVMIWMLASTLSIVYYYLNPGIARIIISYGYGSIAYHFGNPYGLAFGSAIMCSFAFSLFFVRKRSKIAIAVCFIILFSLIIKTESTIAILSVFIGIIYFMLVSSNKKGNTRYIAITITVVITILITFLFRNAVAELLQSIGHSLSGTYSIRFSELANFIRTNQLSHDMQIRIQLMKDSFNAFLHHPLLGSSAFVTSSIYSVGEHSELFDSLARYGIIGGGLYYAIFWLVLRNIHRISSKTTPAAYIITFLILFIFNPLHYKQVSFSLFFMIPAICKSFQTCTIENTITDNSNEVAKYVVGSYSYNKHFKRRRNKETTHF